MQRGVNQAQNTEARMCRDNDNLDWFDVAIGAGSGVSGELAGEGIGKGAGKMFGK